MQRTCMDALFHRGHQRTWEGNDDNRVSQFLPGREIPYVMDDFICKLSYIF